MKKKLLYTGIFLLLALGWFLYQLFGPNAKVRLGRTTTYISEPLAADGLPNYVLALDQMQREGVIPENNGAVPFLRAMGPCENMKLADFALLCDAVGLNDVKLDTFLSMPREDGQLMESIGFRLSKDKASKHWDRESDDEPIFHTESAAYEFLDLTRAYPWAETDSPPLANWVADHQQQLDWLVEAGKQPEFYLPSISALTNPEEELIYLLLPCVQASREAGRALMTRAQLRLGEGDLEGAWGDTFACLRLGEHVGNGPTIIHKLVGIALQGIAYRAHDHLLSHEGLTEALAQQISQDLSALKPRVDMAKAINTGERFFCLDTTLRFCTGRLGGTDSIGDGVEQVAAKAALNPNLMLEICNHWYDRLVEAARIEDYQQRQTALDQINNDLRGLQVGKPKKILGAIFSTSQRSRTVTEILLSLFLPAVSAATHAEDRSQMQLELAQVATALAIYKLQYGEYPKTLEPLTADILEKVPADLFAAAPLNYRRVGEGYLLYSVGKNETDDNGTNTYFYNDDAPFRVYKGEWLDSEQWLQTEADPPELYDEGDDLIIRLPMPKMQWHKAQ
ncbi:MAG: hypothetical protein RH917_03870 [Lacipirellulaceae bacterium]